MIDYREVCDVVNNNHIAWERNKTQKTNTIISDIVFVLSMIILFFLVYVITTLLIVCAGWVYQNRTFS